jgi:guanine deaminase
VPSFVDAHIHLPQVQIVASWGAQHLNWRDGHIFPAETGFADAQDARIMARPFCDALVGHGTMAAVASYSSHPASAEAFFEEAADRDMRMIADMTMLDGNAPEDMRDSKALIARGDGRGRAGYAIAPRSAITSTPVEMEMASALAAEISDGHVQIHLSENRAARDPRARDDLDDLDVDKRSGRVRPRTLLGDVIRLEPREIDAPSQTGAHPVFGPT